jgi:hypothetical protein
MTKRLRWLSQRSVVLWIDSVWVLPLGGGRAVRCDDQPEAAVLGDVLNQRVRSVPVVVSQSPTSGRTGASASAARPSLTRARSVMCAISESLPFSACPSEVAPSRSE